MTDLDDLRRRAAHMSRYGNYWAGKCVALVDRVQSLKRQRDALRRLVADAYLENPGMLAWAEVTGEMAAALDNALDAVAVAGPPSPNPPTGAEE